MLDRGHEWLVAAAPSRSPTAGLSPRLPGTGCGTSTWRRRSTGYGRFCPGSRRARSPCGRTELPPLLRGYLRLGAWVCGEPAYDPDFGVADMYVLLSMRRVDARYLRHFLSLVPAA